MASIRDRSLVALVEYVENHIYLDIIFYFLTPRFGGEKLLTTARFTFDLLPPLCVLCCFPTRFVFSFRRMNKSISSGGLRKNRRFISIVSFFLSVVALENDNFHFTSMRRKPAPQGGFH